MFPSLVRRPLMAALLAVSIFPLLAQAQRGAITAHRDLAEMAAAADVAFRGTVTFARVEPHPDYPGIRTVLVGVRVHKTLKGSPGELFTFRQFIWDIRDRADAAGYRKGHEMVLLLNRPTRIGLTSPTGLQQGRFLVRHDEDGRRIAVNGQGNLRLLEGVASKIERRRLRVSPQVRALVARPSNQPIAVEELEQLVHELGAAQ